MKKFSPARAYPVLAILIVTSLGLSIAFALFWRDWRYVNEPLHSSFEALGAMAAIVMMIILWQRKDEEGNDTFVLLSLGFLTMGILDVFHSGVEGLGQPFALLRTFAGIASSIWFISVWIPGFGAYVKKRRMLSWVVASAATLLGTAIVFSPEMFPVMVENNRFTPISIVLNVLSGVFFIVAAGYFLLHFHRTHNLESYVFVCLFMLLGIAALEFPFSAPWDEMWWMWHLQRLTAFFLVLYHLFYAFSRAKEELEAVNISLEERVARRTAELQGEITERRLAQEALQKSEEMFRSLFDMASDCILLLDPSATGGSLIVDANVAACAMHGYSREELIGKPIQFLDDPDTSGNASASISRLMAGETVRFEINHIRKDGSVFPVEVSTKQININNKPYILAIDRDITERIQAVAALRDSEKKLRHMTAHLGVGMYVLDAEGRVTFMNSEAERLFGYTLEEIREKGGPHYLVHYQRPDGTPLSLEDCVMHNVMKTGKRYQSLDEVFVRRDGTVFPVSVITTPIIDEGKISSVVTAFRDITDDKKLEAELLKTQKLESVGTLAAGIAHDFNNLLQVIMGNISLASLYLTEDEPASIGPCLEHAAEASTAAKELSFRLLTFSKGGEPVRKAVAVENILKRSASLSLSGSPVACEFILPDDLLPVDIDEGQMTQVFNNIIINAREVLPQGGTIRISAENVSLSKDNTVPLKEGKYVRVSILDNGPGIAEEVMPMIFDPYFSTKELGPEKGMGLGLSISLSIVRKHEGHISVETREGRGTTFHVYLPASKDAVQVDERPATEQVLSKKRILWMDDDERMRTFARNMMEHLGYEAAYTKNGEEAIERYRQAREQGRAFDAVILDLTVQGSMGGEEAMAGLLKIDPAVKAVISSGYADAPVMKDFRAFGFADALIKPYTIEKLKGFLESL